MNVFNYDVINEHICFFTFAIRCVCTCNKREPSFIIFIFICMIHKHHCDIIILNYLGVFMWTITTVKWFYNISCEQNGDPVEHNTYTRTWFQQNSSTRRLYYNLKSYLSNLIIISFKLSSDWFFSQTLIDWPNRTCKKCVA